MKRMIYHGSEVIIKEIESFKGNVHNDYGMGFYCCSKLDIANEWAAKKTGHGFVNVYEIRDDRLKILDLTKPPYDNVLYWITLLMNNRVLSSSLKENYPRELEYLKKNYLIDISEYDIIIGYRADDSYFHFPEAFVRSEITLESLNEIFKAGKLGKQYVIKSNRALKLLKFVNYIEVYEKAKEDYYNRKKDADKLFSDTLINDRYKKGMRLRDMVMDND